ncbi:Peptide methionine sulfoxide reductase MrsB [Sesbania bispinosa]|nr:Peptide methionine sulfoxide reductase MrsB [Sesbania bispinosa]
MSMSFNILRTTSTPISISSSKTRPIFSTLLRSPSQFPSKSSTPTLVISIHQGKRSFRGGIVAMAAPGSLNKSEEEWRAILSPQQFQILRQKGIE